MAMNARSWRNEDLVRELKLRGYSIDGPRIVQKWLKGKNQPSAERLDLLELTLGYVITEDPKPRRKFGAIDTAFV